MNQTTENQEVNSSTEEASEQLWQYGFKEYLKNPDKLEILGVMTELSRITGRWKEGIDFGMRMLKNAKGQISPDDVVGCFPDYSEGVQYTMAELLGSIACCYQGLGELEFAKELAELCDKYAGHSTYNSLVAFLNSSYNLYGISACEQIVKRYLDMGIKSDVDQYAYLMNRVSVFYMSDMFKYIDPVTEVFVNGPLTVIQRLLFDARKIYYYLMEVPEDQRDTNYDTYMSVVKEEMKRSSQLLYIGSGTSDDPEMLSNKDYFAARDCFLGFQTLYEIDKEVNIAHILALFYHLGLGTERNDNTSLEYVRIIENENAMVDVEYVILGDCYFKGEGVEQNYEMAFSAYQSAADMGNNYATARLGKMYLNGWGVPFDTEKGITLLRKAVQNGYKDQDGALFAAVSSSIPDFQNKLDYVTQVIERMKNNDRSDFNDRDKSEKFIKLFTEIEAYIPVGLNDRKQFLMFVFIGANGALYKGKGVLDPVWLADYFNKFITDVKESSEETEGENKRFLQIFNCIDYNGQIVQEMKEAGIPRRQDTNWFFIENQVKTAIAQTRYFGNFRVFPNSFDRLDVGKSMAFGRMHDMGPSLSTGRSADELSKLVMMFFGDQIESYIKQHPEFPEKEVLYRLKANFVNERYDLARNDMLEAKADLLIPANLQGDVAAFVLISSFHLIMSQDDLAREYLRRALINELCGARTEEGYIVDFMNIAITIDFERWLSRTDGVVMRGPSPFHNK